MGLGALKNSVRPGKVKDGSAGLALELDQRSGRLSEGSRPQEGGNGSEEGRHGDNLGIAHKNRGMPKERRGGINWMLKSSSCTS